MSNFFKPIAAVLVGCAIVGAAATAVAIPLGLILS